jgi:hypothetical protein
VTPGAAQAVARELCHVEQAALVVRHHGPETTQGLGRYARAELRDVAFQIGTDETFAPALAARIARGCQAGRKAAPQPQVTQARGASLPNMQRPESQVAYAPGQGLARLLEHVQRSRTQHQVAPGGEPGAARLVNLPSQEGERPGCAVHLVQNDQPVPMRLEVQLGLGELATVALELQVQVDVEPILRDFECQGRLADLPWTEERYRRRVAQFIDQEGLEMPGKHHCNNGSSIHKLQCSFPCDNPQGSRARRRSDPC